MKYCSHCGKRLFDEAVICPGCGCEAGNINQIRSVYGGGGNGRSEANASNVARAANAESNHFAAAGRTYSAVAAEELIGRLSGRLRTNGIIWIVIASLQILLGLSTIAAGIGYMPLILGAVNLAGGIHDINYSKSVLSDPRGIVAKIEPLTGTVITLVFNVLVGALIGIVGSIYYLAAIRQLVMNNREVFIEAENRAQR